MRLLRNFNDIESIVQNRLLNDSGSSEGNFMQVRFLLSAPKQEGYVVMFLLFFVIKKRIEPEKVCSEKNSPVDCFQQRACSRVPNAQHWVDKRTVCEADGRFLLSAPVEGLDTQFAQLRLFFYMVSASRRKAVMNSAPKQEGYIIISLLFFIIFASR